MAPSTSSLLITMAAWGGYFILHSVFAAEGIKQSCAKLMGAYFKYYRLIYSTLFILLLLPPVWLTFRGTPDFMFQHIGLRIAGIGILLMGIGVLGWAGAHFDQGEFMGISQIRNRPVSNRLIMDGPYRLVRHPLYFGTILLFNGLFLAYPTTLVLGTTGVVFLYLIIGSRLEERKLLAIYGTAYADYKRTVKGLIPYLF